MISWFFDSLREIRSEIRYLQYRPFATYLHAENPQEFVRINSKFCEQKRNSCERIRKIRKNKVTTSFWIRENELVILNSQ